MRSFAKWVTLGVLVGTSACAVHPVPARYLSESEQAIRTAHEVRASDYPEAAGHLVVAERELRAAKDFIQRSENALAEDELRHCIGDAELATGLAREARQNARSAPTRDSQ